MLALLLLSLPASAIVTEYKAGVQTMKVNQDGMDIEIREGASPGNSIRVYVSPSNLSGTSNCMGIPPVVAGGYFPSDLATVASFVSPYAGYAARLIEQPPLNDNPGCDTKKFGYYTIDTIVNGMIKHQVSGMKKSYNVEVTFGPDPKDPKKTVVLKLRSNSK